jgi:flagellin-like hook-associated protein FlgL
MIRLGSNILSQIAQRNLGRATSDLSTTSERLASGQRINRAGDDAAGLAIADSLSSKSRIFNQGVRNLNDGLSLLNIADSSLEQLSTIVTRLSELAQQAANGSYSNKQRQALDGEAQALAEEYFRIKQSTSFNGISLFDGSVENLRVQGGIGVEGGIAEGLGGAIGTGALGSATSFTGGSGSIAITSGDFNGDGIIDLATANSSANSLSVQLGNGDGSFGAATDLSVGGSARSIVTGDFNGDGILDLIGGNYSDYSARVFLGNGDGNFRSHFSTFGARNITSMATGDLNGDGVLDLITGGDDDELGVLIGRGNGTFNSRVQYTGTEDYVTTGDFNNDGILDAASASRSGGTIGVWIGRGDGTLNARVSYALGGTAQAISAADFNGDGSTDIVAVNGSLNVYLSRGDGTFNSAVSYSANLATSVVPGDFNGDGIPDLAATRQTGNVHILTGTGSGTFNSAVTYTSSSTQLSITSADFNRDGVLDIAATRASGFNVLLGLTKDGVSPLLPFSLRSISDARQAMSLFQQKRDQLSAQRGEIGAFQSRINVGINTLQVASENFKAAESRIRDADIAYESSQSVRLSILQRSSISVLAQANQQPALAIQLLR